MEKGKKNPPFKLQRFKEKDNPSVGCSSEEINGPYSSKMYTLYKNPFNTVFYSFRHLAKQVLFKECERSFLTPWYYSYRFIKYSGKLMLDLF